MSTLAQSLESAQSKFAGYLKDHKIDPIRVVYASEQIETLTPVDRGIKLAKRQSRGKEDDAASHAQARKLRWWEKLRDWLPPILFRRVSALRYRLENLRAARR